MVTDLELRDSFRRLVPAAAAGDRSAATELLGGLIDRTHDRQSAAMAALHAVDSADFWLHLVEFLATGRWRGIRLGIRFGSETWRHKVQMRLHTLLTLHHDPASDVARDAALEAALGDRSPDVRARAADLVGDRRSPEAISQLVRALEDPTPAVRIHAARALGRLGDPAAVEPLLGCLNHRNDALAGAAMEALIRLGLPALPALIQACRSPDEWVRWHAARALGRLHDHRAIPPLVKLLADDDATVRWVAVQSLQRHGSTAIEPVVHALVNGPVTPRLADAAGHVLRQVRDPRLAATLKPLAEHLRDSYAAVSVPTIAEQVLDKLTKPRQT